MPVTEADLRMAIEDLVQAMLVEIYNIKHGEEECLAGVDKSVSFSVPVYDSNDDYIVAIIEAIDIDDIDIRHSVVVKNKTATGFTLNSPRNTTVIWSTTRMTPKIVFHT